MGEEPHHGSRSTSFHRPPAIVTFDPTYPETQHVRRGIGRFSEDDAFEQNDRHSDEVAEDGQGGLVAHEEEEVAFESVDLEDESGAGASGTLSSSNVGFGQATPFSGGLTPTGHTLQRSSFAYGSNGVGGNGRASDDGSSSVGSPSARRPVSENGHGNGSSYIPKNIFTRTFSSGSRKSGESSPGPLSGRKTPIPDTTTSSTSDSTTTPPTPRIHAPPAIPHSLNPSVMAALTSNQYPTTAASSSPKTTPFPSRSSTSAFSLLKRNSLSLAVGGSNRSRTKGAGGMAREGMMDQVRSRTRMVHLPPKDKEEDEAHLERWKHMMEESRLSDNKRQETLIRRRAEREKHLANSVPIWETSILALSPREWKGIVRSDPKLGELWFEGVPSHLRGRVWSGCIGNGLALSKESFRACAYRAKKAIDSGRFPADVMKHIEDDSIATLPTTKLYGKGGPMTDELRELLAAWYVSRVDEGMGYVRGVHLIAGMLLMNMNIAVAYICLRNLLDRSCLRAFYCGVEEETEAYYRIFDNLQADLFPKIYANCKTVDVRIPSTFFTTLFLHQIPFEAAVRVWDLILLEGDGQIFRIGLAILSILEPRLYFPDKKEIQSVFDGKNAAALAIVAREKERARLKGVAYEADVDGVLTVFGVNEDTIFEALGNDGWKESRFDRLLTRELPE